MRPGDLVILDSLLSDQGYDRTKLRDTVIRAMVSNEADYPATQLAWDSEYADDSTKESITSTANTILEEVIYPVIISNGPDYTYDYDELAYDTVTDDTNDDVREYLSSLELEYEYLLDMDREDADRELRYLNRDYIDSVMPRIYEEDGERTSKANRVNPIIKNGKMYLYHICMKKNLKSILANGLDSDYKTRTVSSKGFIYLTNDPSAVAEGDDDFPNISYPVLIVDITDIIDDLELDPEYEDDAEYGVAFMYKGKISPSKIEHYGYLVMTYMGTRKLVKKEDYKR